MYIRLEAQKTTATCGFPEKSDNVAEKEPKWVSDDDS